MNNQIPNNSKDKMVENSTKYIDSFRKNIDMLMSTYNYTIKETAEIADLSYDTFKTFLYSKEAKDCRLSTAVKLARAFHLSIDELVGAGTMEPRCMENLKTYRNLPEGPQHLIDWHIANQKFLHEKHSGTKIVSVMLPICACTGNLKMTNDYEEFCLQTIDDELSHKIFLGIKIPCLHYLPHYTQGDILLLANDRDAMKGENTVIEINGNLLITNRLRENGVFNYYGLRDKKFHGTECDCVEVLGYVAKIIRA